MPLIVENDTLAVFHWAYKVCWSVKETVVYILIRWKEGFILAKIKFSFDFKNDITFIFYTIKITRRSKP